MYTGPTHPYLNVVFYTPYELNPWKSYGSNGIPSLIPKNCASVLTRCLVKLSLLPISICLSFLFEVEQHSARIEEG